MDSITTSRLFKVREAAKYLSISERTLFDLTKEGRLPAVKFNHSVRYDIADLDTFIAAAKGA